MGAITAMGGPTMGTTWSARIVDAPPGCAAAIEAVLARIIAQMSQWEAQSDISRFNRTTPGAWMDLPADMANVLRAGLDMADLSDGAFDPAIGQWVDHWGFGPASAAGFPAAPATSPWRAIEMQGHRARRMRPVALDFSGIAKGYAVDAVAQTLRDMGLDQFLVEIGGEMRGDGVKPDIQPWWVDVESPPGLNLPILRVALYGLAIATSGDYRRYRMTDGQRLSHSIDSASGAPIANAVAGVTVLHDSAMLADAWATAITVLGPERGMALATRHDIPARLIRREGTGGVEYMTPALAAMLE